MPQKAMKMRRFLSSYRVEKGLWTSATGCQRVLMIVGGLLIVLGCHLLSINETFFTLRGLEVAAAERNFVEVPCTGADVDRLIEKHRDTLVHVEDCEVVGQNFSADTAGLSILYAFRGSFPPNGVAGLWFKVELERYAAKDGVWVAIEEFENLHATTLVAPGALLGDFRLSAQLTESMPGLTVPVVQSPDYEPRKRGSKAVDARNMLVHDMKFYSGDPQWPLEGDVRVWFMVGDAKRASALAAWSGERLEMWRAPNTNGDFDPLAPQRKLGIVAPGASPASELLSKVAPFSEADVWPMRGVGFVIEWIGFSFFLFPNHVVPDLCGACCCCRSFPCAAVTTLLVAGLSAFYFRRPLLASAVALSVAGVLFAMAADFNPRSFARRLWRRWKRRIKRRSLRKEQGGYLLASPGGSGSPTGESMYVSLSEAGGLNRTIRLAAMATGVGIIMAGPVVRALALVDVFGDYYDAVN